MKDQINSRIMLMETTIMLTLVATCVLVFTKAAPGLTAFFSRLVDDTAYSFGQWIASASFIH